ncbi:MAG: DUF1697 domain-containing protein [Gaiellales bacterium]
MCRYVVLIRAINVGGKNRLPMADLRTELERLGFTRVSSYLASGNVILSSAEGAASVRELIEAQLPQRLALDTKLIRVHVLTAAQFRKVLEGRPAGFGEQPAVHHSDAVFLMDLGVDDAMAIMNPREGVDQVWPGDGVIYFQRLSAERSKSRLGRIVGTPQYKSMTIRSWQTVLKLGAALAADPAS